MMKPVFEAFRSGEIEPLRGVISRDAVIHVPGRSQLAGAHAGIEGIGRLLWLRRDLSDGTFEPFGADICTTEQRGILTFSARARRRRQTFSWDEIVVAEIRGGRIARAFVYIYDLYAFDAFWS
jgi:ketosteroid isomerase-like protein